MPGRIRLDLEVVGGVDVFRRLQHLRIEGHDTFVRGMVIVEGEPRVGVQLAPNHIPPDWPDGTHRSNRSTSTCGSRTSRVGIDGAVEHAAQKALWVARSVASNTTT
jgi:hypothetical protein